MSLYQCPLSRLDPHINKNKTNRNCPQIIITIRIRVQHALHASNDMWLTLMASILGSLSLGLNFPGVKPK